MRILILGGDGYLGWPQSLYLSSKGHDVTIFDNLSRRHFDLERGFNSLIPIQTLHERISVWNEVSGRQIQVCIGDTMDYEALASVFRDVLPEAVIHFAEQRSAPFSMIDRKHAVFTQTNNVVGTLNVLYALKEFAPGCHLVKLGTMGEYGTPNIDIEEGFIEIHHKGRTDVLPYPKQPGSFYHLCYDDQTEVLTQNGWKLFKDLLDEDEVATRQLDDPHIVYAKPTAHTAFLYEGPMYYLEQRRIDLCVTPNHRMVTSHIRRDGTERMRFEEAKDILGKCNRYLLTSKWEGEEQETFTLPGYYWLGEKKPPIPPIELPMDDWLNFLGWYLAEGTVDGKWRKRAPNRICINQKIGPNSEEVNTIFEKIAAALGCTHSVYLFKDRDQESHYLFCTQLAVYLAQLGNSLTKHIPRQLLQLSKRQLGILFCAMMSGDGMWMNRDRQYGRYYTSSKQLADDVQELAIKLGLSANVGHLDRAGVVRWTQATEYRVNLTKTTAFQVNQQPDDLNDWLEDYAGMVYCCEVPGDGIILVRRNGKPIWCGNSKVHDSHNIMFCCKIWGLRATDLNQGVVYGVETDQTTRDARLATRFDYDQIYGTALNRFCAQAAAGYPLSVYGTGQQTRGYINLRDTIRCIELAITTPPREGEYRVFNQFTEQFSLIELAEMVAEQSKHFGLEAQIQHLPNPRVEAEQHYYNASHTKLIELGLEPHLLNGTGLESLIDLAIKRREQINRNLIMPTVNWRTTKNEISQTGDWPPITFSKE
jgi:nucleoside-diphosphate-sugar epimerase